MRPTRFVALAAVLLLGPSPGRAQGAPPTLATLPPIAVMHTLHTAGFHPVSPPVREGATYVVRATDYRGILMRVVLDARTGAIRDANRIVPQAGFAAAPYGAPPPDQESRAIPPPPVAAPAPASPSVTIYPPLPRPRPQDVAAEPAGDSAPAVAAPSVKTDGTGAMPGAASAAPAAPPSTAAAATPAAVAPVNPSRVPPPLTINN